VDVLIIDLDGDFLATEVKNAVPQVYSRALYGFHARAYHAAEHLVAGLYASGYGGLRRVEGLVVIEKSGGLDHAVPEIMGVQTEFLEGAEHAVAHYAAELAALYLLAAGQQSVVPRHGDYVAHMYVPGAGANLYGLLFAHVHHNDEHVVGIRVLFNGDYPAYYDVLYFLAQIFGGLLLGAGEGHSLGKIPVAEIDLHEFVEPFS
jgi:hypothetical protein